MLHKMLFLSATIVYVLLLTISGSHAFDLAIEAEWANELEAPLSEADDPNASGGKFIWAEGAPLEGGENGDKGWAIFNINLPADGTYAIWGRVIAWDGNSDSFWITWEPTDPSENSQETGNTEFRWSVGQGNDWHWDKINQWLDGGTFERQWEHTAGPTTLTVYTREDATMLDSLYITDVIADDEAEVALREPTEADRRAFTGEGDGTAVEAQGKLATSWAKIKNAR